MASPTLTRRPRGGGALWRVVAGLSCVVGLVAAWLQLGSRGFLVCLAFTTALTLCLVLAVCGPGVRRARWVRATVLIGVMSTAGLGLASALGVPGLLWMGVLAGSSPPGRRLLAGWLDTWMARAGSADAPRGEPAAPLSVEQVAAADPPTPAAHDLDDEALCLAWRRSFVQLAQATTTAARLHRVQQRQLLLDELERRHPEGLAAWLASGARAAGNPLPYLSRPRSS